MIRVYFIPLLVFILSFLGLLYLPPKEFCLYNFYSQKMQTSLFTGFLTIGGFLLSLKTFILVKLKEDLYDLPAYKKRLAEQRELNPNLSHYGPLSRLGFYLVSCVFGALITSLFQFSIGFLNYGFIAAICISIAAATLSSVFLAWWEIRKNLLVWFQLLEKK